MCLVWVAQPGEQMFYLNKATADTIAAINSAQKLSLSINKKGGCGISWANSGGVIAAWELAKSAAKRQALELD